jgi:hypothetical protein
MVTIAKKRIFCLEGLWEQDLTKKSTILPILELLYLNDGIEYIYRDCATREETEFYLKKWTQEKYAFFPILFLAFHGEEGVIHIGKTKYPVDHLSDILAGKCENAIIFFASCRTLGIDKRNLKKILETTHALAICGYRSDVDWMKSAAFELLVLNEMQLNSLTMQGADAIRRRIIHEYPKMVRDFNFIMLTKSDVKAKRNSVG